MHFYGRSLKPCLIYGTAPIARVRNLGNRTVCTFEKYAIPPMMVIHGDGYGDTGK